MEEYGIGRPSTYAATITTITSREYVKREGKTLIPTELGEVSTQLMRERFPKIVNVKFTAQMEKELDTVEKGETQWVQLLDDFYQDFDKTLKKAKEDMEGVKLHLKEDETDLICEYCGRKMVVKFGRYGKFIACPGYPECKNIKKFVQDIGVACPKCGGKVIVRKTKKGKPFYGCENYPECKYIKKDPVELEYTGEECPKCGGKMVFKNGRFGRFEACSNYPECKYIKNSKKKEPVMTDEVCPNCGSPVVIKQGRYGEFKACSNYPKCKTIIK